MLLKELPQGSPVFILSNGPEGVKAFESTIAAEPGKPHYKNSQPNNTPSQAFMPPVPQVNTDVVIDIYVNIEGESIPFEINQNSTMAKGKYVSKNTEYTVSIERDAILREVQAIKLKSEEYLKNVAYHQSNIQSCDNILETWDPATAEKKRNDQRLTSMENRIGGMEDKINKMFEEFQNMNRK